MDFAPYELLHAARVALGISQPNVAKEAGVSQRSMVRIEACEHVSLETRLKVQRTLERHGAEFILGDDQGRLGFLIPASRVSEDQWDF